jgi:hypothetical protein
MAAQLFRRRRRRRSDNMALASPYLDDVAEEDIAASLSGDRSDASMHSGEGSEEDAGLMEEEEEEEEEDEDGSSDEEGESGSDMSDGMGDDDDGSDGGEEGGVHAFPDVAAVGGAVAADGAAASPAGSASITAAVTFGPFSSSAAIQGILLYDSATINSGSLLAYGTLQTARTVFPGDTIILTAGQLNITLA